jgi:hypothetical protein
VDGGDQTSQYQIINNYFKPGPATPDSVIAHRVLKPDGRRAPGDKTGPREWGKAYVAGNVVAGNDAISKDNWAGGVQIDGDDDPKVILPRVKVEKPFPMPKLPELQPAPDAYESVLAHVGATRPKRDAVDARIVESVRKGTAAPDTKQGIITDIKQVGGHPRYTGERAKDADGDGLPDEWEAKHGLNPNDPADATKDSGDGYAVIEKYISGLDPKAKVDWKDLKNNRDAMTK